MKINKISNTEFEKISVSSLPIRPNRYSNYGKEGMSAEELKASFDKTAQLLKERLNSLIDTIYSQNTEASIASEMRTGIEDVPTLKDFFESVENGTLASKIKLTDEYNLLDFVTKMMSFAFPERAVEFIKVKKQDGVYKLPNEPYLGHEEAIYLMPSNSSLTVFNSYVWNGAGWELWSTGTLENYLTSLSAYIEELSESMATRDHFTRLERTKADQNDLYELMARSVSSYNGSPYTYNGSLEDLSHDSTVSRSRIYLICDPNSSSFGYWCYFNGVNWSVGGKYLDTLQTTPRVSKFDAIPVESRGVKAHVDSCVFQSLSQFARDCTGFVNLFDASAVTAGYIDSSSTIIPSDSYITTDYMDITTSSYLYCSCCSKGIDKRPFNPVGICLYDLDKMPLYTSAVCDLSGMDCKVKVDHSTHKTARYIRISFPRETFDTTSRHIIVSDIEASEYVPFYDFRLRIDNKMDSKSEMPVKNSVIKEYVDKKTHRLQWLFGGNASYPKFDTVNNKLIFNPDGSDSEGGFLLDGNFYRFEAGKPLEISIAPTVTLDKDGFESNTGKVCINCEAIKSYTPNVCSNLAPLFSVQGADSALPSEHYLPIATFKRGENEFSAWMDCPFFVDNKLFGVMYTSEEMESKIVTYTTSDDEDILIRASAISDALSEVSEPDSFRFGLCFLSDNDNTKKAMAIYRNVAKNISLSFLGACGIGNDPATLRAISQKESEVPFLYTMGDGDLGAKDRGIGTLPDGKTILPSDSYIPPKIYHMALGDQAKNVRVVRDVQNPEKAYFYTDIDDACVRILFINTSDLVELDVSLPQGSAYTDNNNLITTLSEELVAKKYSSIDTRAVCDAQLKFISEQALDFSDKINPSDWAVITVQCAPLRNLSEKEFCESYTENNGLAVTKILNAFLASDALRLNESGDFSTNLEACFYGRGGKVLASISTSYDRDAKCVEDNVTYVGCRESTIASAETDGIAPVCDFFSISRSKGTIDIIRGGAGENLHYTIDSDAPKKRNERGLLIDISETSDTILESKNSYFASSYIQNSSDGAEFGFLLPENISYGFSASLSLAPSYAPLEFSCPDEITFVGLHTSDGVFTPLVGYKYTINIWHDGRCNAQVLGFPVEQP